MQPVKSVSGIIGIGAKVQYHDYPCKPCPMKDCLYRKDGKSTGNGIPGLSGKSRES